MAKPRKTGKQRITKLCSNRSRGFRKFLSPILLSIPISPQVSLCVTLSVIRALNHHSTIYPWRMRREREREKGYLHTFRVITDCISKNYADIGVVSGKFFLSLPSPPGERPFPLAILDEKQGGKSCRAITRFLSP